MSLDDELVSFLEANVISAYNGRMAKLFPEVALFINLETTIVTSTHDESDLVAFV